MKKSTSPRDLAMSGDKDAPNTELRRITIDLEKSDHRALKMHAMEQDVSIASIVRQWIRIYCKQ